MPAIIASQDWRSWLTPVEPPASNNCRAGGVIGSQPLAPGYMDEINNRASRLRDACRASNTSTVDPRQMSLPGFG